MTLAFAFYSAWERERKREREREKKGKEKEKARERHTPPPTHTSLGLVGDIVPPIINPEANPSYQEQP